MALCISVLQAISKLCLRCISYFQGMQVMQNTYQKTCKARKYSGVLLRIVQFYENNIEWGSSKFCKIPSTSVCFKWLWWEPHMAYSVLLPEGLALIV